MFFFRPACLMACSWLTKRMVYFDAKITEWFDLTILNLLSYVNRF